MVLLLNNDEVEKSLRIDDCLKTLERAYKDLSNARAINRPRTHTFTPTSKEGTFHLFKTIEGGSPGLGVFALRINSELWTAPTNGSPRVKKVPAVADGRYTEFIMLFSVENGQLLAILPDGYIQKMRVAMTHALASKYLARNDAQTLGLFGSGWQASAQALVQSKVGGIKRIKVYSPTAEHRQRFAKQMEKLLRIEVRAMDEPSEVMREADIVIAATDSLTPVIRHQWLEEGMHLSSVRAWSEIEKEALEKCDRAVVHNRTKALNFVCGDEIPKEMVSGEGLKLDTEKFPQLCDIVGGKLPGRTSGAEITLFIDGDRAGGPGIGIQFATVGLTVYKKAKESGLGKELPLDWFLDREDHPYLETLKEFSSLL
jgi:ornithine cyclodeaminase/alanine dehydrogenase-like protein (mu-crystallin family)